MLDCICYLITILVLSVILGFCVWALIETVRGGKH